MISKQIRQTGGTVKTSALAISLMLVLAIAAPAAADIKPPLWTGTPLPESANQPGTIAVGGSGCGPSGAVVFRDDFEIDGEPEATETGQTWISDSNGTWEVADSRLVYTADDAVLGYLVADSGFADGRMSFTVNEISDTFWSVFRYRDPLNLYRFGRDNGGSYEFEKIENGVIQSFAPFGRDLTPRGGDRIDITFEADDSINIYRDDDWLYGDGQVFNITETFIGFSTRINSVDDPQGEFRITDLKMVPFSGVPVTASVQINAVKGGVSVSEVSVNPDNDGNWTTRLDVPIETAPTDYSLTAACHTPGYEIVYVDLSVRVGFSASSDLITDFVAAVDFERVEESPTFDPVTASTIVALAMLALGVLLLGGFAARRLSGSRET